MTKSIKEELIELGLIERKIEDKVSGKYYANRVLWSDIDPHEIVEVRTKNKILVRAMDAEKNPNWKADFHPGGFSGHVSNQDEQKWFYKSNETNPVFAIWKRKDGYFYDGCLRFSLNKEPIKFYDYNF